MHFPRLPLLQRLQHGSALFVFIYNRFSTYLYSNHREDLNWDPVKFVKTAPSSCLGKAFVNIPTRLGKKKKKENYKCEITNGINSSKIWILFPSLFIYSNLQSIVGI